MNLLFIFWDLVVESAPWLLAGYLLAGIIRQVIPSSWVERQLATPGFFIYSKGGIYRCAFTFVLMWGYSNSVSDTQRRGV